MQDGKMKRKFPFIGNRIRKEKNWKKRVMECKKAITCADCVKQKVFAPLEQKILFRVSTKPKFVRSDEWDGYEKGSRYDLANLEMKELPLTDEFWEGMEYGVGEW